MSETVSENKTVLQDPAEKSAGERTQVIVIGILVLTVAAMLVWQFMGCASCYSVFYTGT